VHDHFTKGAHFFAQPEIVLVRREILRHLQHLLVDAIEIALGLLGWCFRRLRRLRQGSGDRC
jgi:hypothetical protein